MAAHTSTGACHRRTHLLAPESGCGGAVNVLPAVLLASLGLRLVHLHHSVLARAATAKQQHHQEVDRKDNQCTHEADEHLQDEAT